MSPLLVINAKCIGYFEENIGKESVLLSLLLQIKIGSKPMGALSSHNLKSVGGVVLGGMDEEHSDSSTSNQCMAVEPEAEDPRVSPEQEPGSRAVKQGQDDSFSQDGVTTQELESHTSAQSRTKTEALSAGKARESLPRRSSRARDLDRVMSVAETGSDTGNVISEEGSAVHTVQREILPAALDSNAVLATPLTYISEDSLLSPEPLDGVVSQMATGLSTQSQNSPVTGPTDFSVLRHEIVRSQTDSAESETKGATERIQVAPSSQSETNSVVSSVTSRMCGTQSGCSVEPVQTQTLVTVTTQSECGTSDQHAAPQQQNPGETGGDGASDRSPPSVNNMEDASRSWSL